MDFSFNQLLIRWLKILLERITVLQFYSNSNFPPSFYADSLAYLYMTYVIPLSMMISEGLGKYLLIYTWNGWFETEYLLLILADGFVMMHSSHSNRAVSLHNNYKNFLWLVSWLFSAISIPCFEIWCKPHHMPYVQIIVLWPEIILNAIYIIDTPQSISLWRVQ